ncbi:hypothetical protein DMB95_02555 [Campylobacter sp. MIT 12-8780]|uniref:hypothetical protein n=1 Tax=unclassified Campylobacter TaxID=2593542 RepID=UPI00115F3F0C|nr:MULTISPECIES: hypothetical protein [unclassified Campylobacter]NDJ26655.1 hypothetical protein [Campylobacter sp. MIT 19-121]TQR42516.1 hypothetical protein DMB95_02555 [Campylobacter sp. MIT 12-8780]
MALKQEKKEDFKLCDTRHLASHCGYDLEHDELGIKESLEQRRNLCDEELQKKLENIPLEIKQEKSKHFKHELEFKAQEMPSLSALPELLQEIKEYNAKFDTKFYTKELKQRQAKEKDYDAKDLHKNALNSWEECIQEKLNKHKENLTQNTQTKLIKDTKEWLELIRKMQESFDEMGEAGEVFKDGVMNELKEGLASGRSADEFLQDSEARNHFRGGSGADRGKGELKKRIQNLSSWLKLLNQESVKKLCDMLGKLTKEEKKLEFEKIQSLQSYDIKIRTPHIKEEITGIVLGRDLENTLPSELALIDDTDFGILFDLKFSENRLFCFEKQGFQSQSKQKMIDEEKEKELSEAKGPIILCVDTSSSMSGTPETIAKVVALYIAKRAMEQKRACYLINFSDDIHTLDLSPPNNLFKLYNFLELSFNGGTDALPALEAGFKKMKEEAYQKADMLVISDFIFSDYDTQRIKTLMKQKDETNKCYALYVGSFGDSLAKTKLFDDEFVCEANGRVSNLSLKIKTLKAKI